MELSAVGHFRVHFCLYMKAILRAKSLLGISLFIHNEIRINYHNKLKTLHLDSL